MGWVVGCGATFPFGTHRLGGHPAGGKLRPPAPRLNGEYPRLAQPVRREARLPATRCGELGRCLGVKRTAYKSRSRDWL